MKKLLSNKLVLFILMVIYLAQALMGLGFSIIFYGFYDVNSLLQIKPLIMQLNIIPIIGTFCLNLIIRIIVTTVIDLRIKSLLQSCAQNIFFWPYELVFELSIIFLLFVKLFPILGYVGTIVIVFICIDATTKVSNKIIGRIQKSAS